MIQRTSTGVSYAAVIGGYLLAFAGLTLALGKGLGIGVAYGIWRRMVPER